MSGENPSNLIRSFNVQTNFATGPVAQNKLVPPQYTRIKTLYTTTWREQSLASNLDWDSKAFAVQLPQSLRVVKNIFLKVTLPAASAGNFKKYPGLFVIKEVRLVSNGKEVYTSNVGDHLADYMESLTEEQLLCFGQCWLGHQEAMTGATRDVLIPIPLPNSAYNGRAGYSQRGHGIFPAQTGNNPLEIQITLNSNKDVCATSGASVASISGSCSLLYHQVEMTTANMDAYSDAKGRYSVVTRRFTELTTGWQAYGTPNAVVRFDANSPQGCITEIQIRAIDDSTHGADETQYTYDYIKPSKIKCIADSVVQRDLDAPFKVRAELMDNGFCQNSDFPSPGRMCFAQHCANNTYMYSGGYNMSLASNVTFEIAFAQACRYKIVAVQLQRVKIDSDGHMTSSLE